MLVQAHGSKAAIKAPLTPAILAKLKAVPARSRWQGSTLIFDPTPEALTYVQQAFPDIRWEDSLRPVLDAAIYVQLNRAAQPRPELLADFSFKTQPYNHQLRAFKLSRDAEAFALLMEQGTGKSKVLIDTAAYRYAKGDIDALLVLAPNGVHRNWVDNELPTHMPDWVDWKACFWRAPSSASKTHLKRWDEAADHPGLAVLTLNIEAMTQAATLKQIRGWLGGRRGMVVIDESTRIKEHDSVRTKNVLKLRDVARVRRIATGTPVTQGPLDLYAPFLFLNQDILGFDTYSGYRRTFAIMQAIPGQYYDAWVKDPATGRSHKVQKPVETVVGYRNTDHLQRLLEPVSFRVLKKDCLDLPEKVYKKHPVELSAEQRRLMKEIKDNLMVELAGKTITAPLAITLLLRLRQMLGGWVDGVALDPNPRLKALMEVVADIPGKAIIWACFKDELRGIAEALRAVYGRSSVVEYHGDVGTEARARALTEFQEGKARWFVGHPVAGGIGLTLTAASDVVYYSNDYSLETRLQSEDRAHRIGQKNTVTYTDLYAAGTVDERVVEALRGKKDLASQITGDELLSWI